MGPAGSLPRQLQPLRQPARNARRERLVKEYEAQQEQIAKEEEYIRRNIAGQNTAQAKGRLRGWNASSATI